MAARVCSSSRAATKSAIVRPDQPVQGFVQAPSTAAQTPEPPPVVYVTSQTLRFAWVAVDSIATAVAVSNDYAPEHLIIQTRDARALLDAISNAGSVFLGPWSPESMGDYCSGTNHVLPTARTARFASALRVDTFRKHVHFVEATASGLAGVADEGGWWPAFDTNEEAALVFDMALIILGFVPANMSITRLIENVPQPARIAARCKALAGLFKAGGWNCPFFQPHAHLQNPRQSIQGNNNASSSRSHTLH